MVKKSCFYVCLIIIFIYLIPFIIFGQNQHVLIHDNMDSHISWFKVLTDNHMVFVPSDKIVPNIMNGLPRSVFGSEFNVIIWLYNIFPPYTAYVINQFLMHFLAFFGMLLLFKNHILKDNQESIVLGVSLTFALLPFFPSGGLSVAGQPLVLYAFLNFRSNDYSWRDWLIILLVPLYSSLILSFSFFLFFMGCLFVFDLIKNRRINFLFLLAIIIMAGMFVIVEYRLVYSMFFDSGFVSHRNSWSPNYINTKSAIQTAMKNFIFGQYHAASLQQYFVGISTAIALLILVFKKKFDKNLIICLTIVFFISLWYGFWHWEAWNPLKDSFAILRSFNFSRFHFLHPLLWYIIFALSLSVISDNLKYGKKFIVILIICQCIFLFYNSDEMNERRLGNPGYAQFYSENLFSEIDNYIGKDKSTYRVASIGLHPSIAQYNEFYTLDGYITIYPNSYKKEFRKLIEKELDKNKHFEKYYDGWGSRVYIFVDELDGKGFLIQKSSELQVRNLELNTDAFRMMGGEYIFSAVEILNAEHNNLELCNIFERNDSPWRIYLYEAKHINK